MIELAGVEPCKYVEVHADVDYYVPISLSRNADLVSDRLIYIQSGDQTNIEIMLLGSPGTLKNLTLFTIPSQTHIIQEKGAYRMDGLPVLDTDKLVFNKSGRHKLAKMDTLTTGPMTSEIGENKVEILWSKSKEIDLVLKYKTVEFFFKNQEFAGFRVIQLSQGKIDMLRDRQIQSSSASI